MLQTPMHSILPEIGTCTSTVVHGITCANGVESLLWDGAVRQHLAKCISKVVMEQLLIFSILLHPRLELIVVDQSKIGWKHHQGLGGLICVLLISVPLPLNPLLLQEVLEISVVESKWCASPWTIEATS